MVKEERKLPFAPRSTSLTSLIANSPVIKTESKGFFTEFGTKLYQQALKSSPPIWSDSESDDEWEMESIPSTPVDSLDFDDNSIKLLLEKLDLANEKLALNPKTILAENGCIHLERVTFEKLSAPPSQEFWTQFLEQDSLAQLKKLPHLLISKVRSAPIPQDLRAKVWMKFCCVDGDSISETYRDLLKQESNCSRLIEKDIGRTFPNSNFFRDSSGHGQQKLFRILKMTEEQVFAILVRLMGMNSSDLPSSPLLSQKFGIKSLFQPDMQGLHLVMFQHSVFLKQYSPKLYAHLIDLDIIPTMYASPWFLTMFSYNAPLELIYRIFDLIFAEGPIIVLMRLSISLLIKNVDLLLSISDFESVLLALKASRLLEIYNNDLEAVTQDSIHDYSKINYLTLKDLEERYKERNTTTART